MYGAGVIGSYYATLLAAAGEDVSLLARGRRLYHNIPSRDRQAILLETLRVLKKGGSFAIHDLFSKDKYGDMQVFVKKLRDLGFKHAELISTDNGKFMSPWEARWMALSGSALLVGKK